jgi:Ca2+:H+ antiporter
MIAWALILIPPIFPSLFSSLIRATFLVVTVLAAVHHADVIAHRTGEPYGTIILAVAVTIIEVSLIMSIMLASDHAAPTLARDTVFAVVMIILTGLVGLCLLVGGFQHREQVFARHGVSAALVTLTVITALTLILPNYTTTLPGPVYSKSQLLFVSIVSLALYFTFILVQTVRHREDFISDAEKKSPGHLPVGNPGTSEPSATLPGAKENMTAGTLVLNMVILLICLAAVVLLAKKLAPAIESGVRSIGAPQSLVGIIVAMVILLPEGVAAVRAARKNRLQTSLNLALGSALASIGLTIPAVGFAAIFGGIDVVTLGIDAKSTMLLVLALFTIVLSFGTGRTTILQGVVLLVLFAVYLFVTIFP